MLNVPVGDLPRDRTQAYNFKMKQKGLSMADSYGNSSSQHDTWDMLYIVMEQCKCTERNDKFVQDVICAPEPMAVLCNEQQLCNLIRICCDLYEFGILKVDPTFNLGEFSVTLTAYRHWLVQNSAGNYPLMLGPMLVHYHKEFHNYNYFFFHYDWPEARRNIIKSYRHWWGKGISQCCSTEIST